MHLKHNVSQVDLPIHLSSGDTVFVSFSGEGLDRSQECSRAAEVKAVQVRIIIILANT